MLSPYLQEYPMERHDGRVEVLPRPVALRQRDPLEGVPQARVLLTRFGELRVEPIGEVASDGARDVLVICDRHNWIRCCDTAAAMVNALCPLCVAEVEAETDQRRAIRAHSAVDVRRAMLGFERQEQLHGSDQ